MIVKMKVKYYECFVIILIKSNKYLHLIIFLLWLKNCGVIVEHKNNFTYFIIRLWNVSPNPITIL